MVPELVHHVITLVLEKGRRAAPASYPSFIRLSAISCLLSGAAKDNPVDIGIIVHYPFQREVFIFGMHHIINVPYAAGARFSSDGDLHRFFHVFPSNFADLLAWWPRKATCSSPREVRWISSKSSENHVQHLVRFVKHHGMNFFRGRPSPG